MLKKVWHIGLALLLIAFFEIFIANQGFMESFIGAKYTPLRISALRVILYLLILFLVFFYDEAKKLFTYTNSKLEKKFFNKEYNYKEFKFEKLFLTLGLTFGILFVFLVPPINVPDEASHFLRAYWLAHGVWFPHFSKSGSPIGFVPAEISNFVNKWPGNTMFSFFEKADKHNFFDSFMGLTAPTTSYNTIQYTSAQITPILYIPQAFGMLVGRVLFHIIDKAAYNAYAQFCFARIFNLLFYLIMTYHAIKISPVFKRTFTIIALMPNTLFMASSCSYDVFVYSFCFMFIAYIFKCAYDPDIDKIRRKQIIILALLFTMVCISKYAYFSLAFLFILIPREKFDKNLRRKICSFLILFGTAIFFIILWSIIYKLGVPQKAADTNAVNASLQIKFILHNPIKYSLILFYSLFKSGKTYMCDFVADLGWFSSNLPIAFSACYILLIILSSFFEKCPRKIELLHRIVIAFAAFVCYAFAATGMYIYFTSLPIKGGIGATGIAGVQGRYFIPFAMCIFFVFANRLSSKSKFFEKIHYSINNYIPGILASSLAVSSFVMLIRYWVQ